MIRGWRAYYPGGSTLDSTDVEPDDLPPGIACIVQYMDAPYREVVSGGDWYTWDGDRWSHTGTGEWGIWQDEPDGIAVRSCERLDPEDYDEILEQVMRDDRWP